MPRENHRFRTIARQRTWLWSAAAGIGAATVLALAGCGPAHRLPNILLITLDTTRADHLGAYGSTNALTPSLDRLAESGCVFENAFTVAPITLPAHATLLTGRLPFEHGLRVNGENRLGDTVCTLAEHLRARGYQSAAFISAFVLDSTFGLDQGFDFYDDEIDAPVVVGQNRLLRERPADVVASRAIQWLSSRRRPWFCWIHFFDPHYPYRTWSDVFGSRFENAAYQAEIAYMDLQIGRVLDYLNRSGEAKSTLVIAVADHGECLGEHGEMQHGLTLYQSAVRVPLIMRWPRHIIPGTRVTAPVSLADIAPTVLEAARIAADPTMSGRSLWPLIRGKRGEQRVCYMETHMPFADYGWAPLAGLVADTWKYIRAPRPELYRLDQDPEERNNVIDNETLVAERLSAALEDILARPTAAGTIAVQLTPDQKRALLSLGYVSGHGPAPDISEWAARPDVKDMLPLVQMANDAQTLLNEGRAVHALAIAEDLVRRDPQNAQFQVLLATSLGALGHLKNAETILTSVLARDRQGLTLQTYLDATKLLALCRERQGDRLGAERLLREALREDPHFVEALNGLAWLLATGPELTPERATEALTLSRQAVEATGRREPSYLDTYAAACAANGLFDEALSTAELARHVAVQQGRSALASAIADRIHLYRTRRRYVMASPRQN